jgi:hypothetical protein
MQRREKKAWRIVARRPVYPFLNNSPMELVDALGLVSWQNCFDTYTRSLGDEERDGLRSCLESRWEPGPPSSMVSSGGYFPGNPAGIGVCLARCTGGRALVMGARIVCCGLGVGSGSFDNPCTIRPVTRSTCQECCEQSVCAGIVQAGIDPRRSAIKRRIEACECKCPDNE